MAETPEKRVEVEMTIRTIVFVISGSLDDTNINRAKLKLIGERLRELSGDASLKIIDIDIDDGSIKIILKGSKDGLQQIQEFVDSGELTEVEDIPVEYARPLNDQEISKTEAKLRLVQAIRNQHTSDLTGANLTGANLTGANLTGANFIGANFREADLTEVNLTEANFIKANFIGVNLTKANLTGTNFIGVNLREADLTKANLTGTNFIGVNLTKADLMVTNLTGTNLIGVNLTEAKLMMANLTGANLTEANLSRAYLLGANLTGTNLIGVDLLGANLTGADLESASVNKAIFGNNAGIDETMKAKLIKRGAIFRDSPGASVLT